MKFLSGTIFGILVLPAGGAAFVSAGSLQRRRRACRRERSRRSVAGFALDRSVARRAPETRESPQARPRRCFGTAASTTRTMCVTCHGAPGVDASEVGEGLNPPAPDLTLARCRSGPTASCSGSCRTGSG